MAFRKIKDISITRSRWLVTFVIDLQPYERLLNKLTVINTSKVEISENRHRINELEVVLHKVDAKFINIRKSLEVKVDKLEHYLIVYLKCSLVFVDIIFIDRQYFTYSIYNYS